MADETNIENGLPPKLDLRRNVISPLASGAAPLPATAVPPAAPNPAVQLASSTDTMRIKLPSAPALYTPKPIERPGSVGSSPTPLRTPPSGIAPAGGINPAITPLTAKPATPTPLVARPAMATLTAITPAAATPALATPAPAPVPVVSAAVVEPAPSPAAAEPAAGTASIRPVIRPMMVPKTIKLKKPVPLGIKREGPDPDAVPGSKRETSKISLPMDLDATEDEIPAAPKTIQIAPSSTAPISIAADAPPAPPQPAPDPKRQTSRISLESVLGNDSSASPKTIKLKRPGTSATIRVQGLEAPTADAIRQKTSTIDLPAAEEVEPVADDTPDSQKKTIKVKRPSVRPSIHTGGGASGSSDGPMMFTPPVHAAPPADGAHWTFIFAACAATIIICVLIYVLCAQVMGPNISLTELAYFAPDAELPWPGRILR